MIIKTEKILIDKIVTVVSKFVEGRIGYDEALKELTPLCEEVNKNRGYQI